MPCCGAGRARVSGALPNPRTESRAQTQNSATASYQSAGVIFEYVGGAGLTVHGPVTGRTYVFPKPGAQLAADARDANSLLTVPLLRRVRGS
jgi:hypothetical protein